MADEQRLNELRDIIAPANPDWWPPAPGWWIVLVLVAVTLAFAVLGFVRRLKARRRRQRLRRAIDEQLDAIYTAWTETGNAQPFVAELSILLKRVARQTHPAERVGALTPREWVAFLDRTCDDNGFRDGPYHRSNEPLDAPALISLAHRWLSKNL